MWVKRAFVEGLSETIEFFERQARARGQGGPSGLRVFSTVFDEPDRMEIEGPEEILKSVNEVPRNPLDLSNVSVIPLAEPLGAPFDHHVTSYVEEWLSVNAKVDDDLCHNSGAGCSSNSPSAGAVLNLRGFCACRCCNQDRCLEQRECDRAVVVTSCDPEADESPLMAAVSVSDDVDMRAYAVIDSGATETVGSLPAIEDLLAVRYETYGRTEEFRVSDAPPRRFRFGNGALGSGVSHLLLMLA